jgi:receptor expression-enhancing protein 5/6
MPSRSLSSTIASYEKQLDQTLAKYPSMLKLERKLGVPKARIVAGAGLAVAAYALLHLASTMLIALVIFAYPAFMTMRAMESGSKSEHSLWLAYWVSAAALQLGEAFTMGALSHVIPFYTILKLALHMWLYLPATQVP